MAYVNELVRGKQPSLDSLLLRRMVKPAKQTPGKSMKSTERIRCRLPLVRPHSRPALLFARKVSLYHPTVAGSLFGFLGDTIGDYLSAIP